MKPTKKQLENLYIKKKIGAVIIGKRLGMSKPTVYQWLRKYEIPIDHNRRHSWDKTEKKRISNQSIDRMKDDSYKKRATRGLTPKYGADNPAWKGGRIVKDTGYVYLWKPDHPNAPKHGYVAEHRIVMEKHLGRILITSEHIHHLNYDKSDNRIENLILLNPRDHGKQHLSSDRAKEMRKLKK